MCLVTGNRVLKDKLLWLMCVISVLTSTYDLTSIYTSPLLTYCNGANFYTTPEKEEVLS